MTAPGTNMGSFNSASTPARPDVGYLAGSTTGNAVASTVPAGGMGTLAVFWGWISNPVRLAKLGIGVVLILGALWLSFRDSPIAQQAKQTILLTTAPEAATPAAAAGL